jgi:S1-C subfamily serine protease
VTGLLSAALVATLGVLVLLGNGGSGRNAVEFDAHQTLRAVKDDRTVTGEPDEVRAKETILAQAPLSPQAAPGAGPGDLSTKEVVKRTEGSVALVKGHHGSGSGFLAAPGLLVTNAHVVGDEIVRNLEVYFPSSSDGSKGPYPVRLGYENRKRDLAILKVETKLSPLTVSNHYRFQKGEEITIIGNPGVRFIQNVIPNAVSRGVFSSEITWKGHRYYQLGASVNPGNSGGPALDATGAVIGIVTLKASEEAIGFCIPAEDVLAPLASLQAATPGEIDLVERKHDAGAVFCLLREIGALYGRGLETDLAAMAQSLQRGGTVDAGLGQVARLISETLNKKDAEASVEFRDRLPELVNDEALSIDVRQGLKELWMTYSEMKSYVDSPRGTYASFREKSVSLKDRYDRAVKSLELNLGIEPDD